jgi:hypothetical protein
MNNKKQWVSVRTNVAAAALGAMVCGAMLAGCKAANEYQPQATPEQLSSYAAQQHFPVDQTPVEDLHVTAVLDAANNQIQIRVWGGEQVSAFNLWLNGGYVLHIDRLVPPKPLILNLSQFFNSQGVNDLTTDKVQRVQFQASDGKLYNVQGPQTM